MYCEACERNAKGKHPKHCTPEYRFWRKVQKSEGCWKWTACLNDSGYGLFRAPGGFVRAHRYAWELINGPIPPGLFACHKCDTRDCVNPAHIFLGTAKENMEDCSRKGRVRNQVMDLEYCKRGHRFAGDNVVERPDGKRYCRACAVLRASQSKAA